MKWLSSSLRSLRGKWEAFIGTPTLRVVNVQHQDPRDGYVVRTNTGQHIEIFCRELIHEFHYQKWWVPDRRIRMYQVYCVCSADTAEALKLRLDEDFTVRRPLHIWAGREAQKKAAIDCYVDLVLHHFRLS